MKADFSSEMSKISMNFMVKKSRKTFAESKLLSAVTVLQRDKKRHFLNFIYLIINNLIFKNWHWKVPHFPPRRKKQCLWHCFFRMKNQRQQFTNAIRFELEKHFLIPPKSPNCQLFHNITTRWKRFLLCFFRPIQNFRIFASYNFYTMYSLYLKEIKSFLSSVLGYVFIAVFLIVAGLFLWVFPNINNVIFAGLSDIQGLFNVAEFLFIFLVPAITMRSFAEERKSGTLELLFTKPLTDNQIIGAKFLACLTLLVITLIPTLVYVVTVYLIGNPVGNIDMGSTWGSYLGLILLGSAFISIGLFSSSLTNNQIVAFIIAALLCFIMFFAFDFIYSFDALGNFGYFIKTLGIADHYSSISKGVVDSRDLIYFLSVIFLFLFGTRIVLLSRKW